MKTRSGIFTLVAILFVVTLSTGMAHAGAYTCTVAQAGPTGAGTDVKLVLSDTATEPVFTNRAFKALAGREKEMLAVALTAISSGGRVKVVADTKSGIVSSMFLMAP